MHYEVDDICRGIEQEQEDTPVFHQFPVQESVREGSLWRVRLKNNIRQPVPLDESLEGAQAWWVGPPSGVGDVLAVIPEYDELVLRFTTARPPDPWGIIRIYPPRFLDKLLALWKDENWARRCVLWAEAEADYSPEDGRGIMDSDFPWLRDAQRKAFGLTRWPVSFLWGPPGTGKTTTLGAMVAAYLLEKPHRTVLLQSTTNSAVDQALIAVDKALAQLGTRNRDVLALRDQCKRIGSRFVAKYYEGRTHLLPQKDPELVRALIEHASRRPDERDVQAYAAWKAHDESLRQQRREASLEVLRSSRLVAMTTTRAAFDIDLLQEVAPFDLLVVDEASQVSLAHGLGMGPLANQTICAGDPKQLAPIVRSDKSEAVKWLGQSVFELNKYVAPPEATCFLAEQSRMARPICEVVSRAFYDGRLVVAKGCESDGHWKTERDVGVVEKDRFQLVGVVSEGQWSAKYGGPIRSESADHILELLRHHLHSTEPEQIAVLCPFRAQRSFIRSRLRQAEIRGVTVSTVHRAQGSERKIVFFDPVMGANSFLTGKEGGRLINVALSRAMALLYVFASSGDLSNPHLKAIAIGQGTRMVEQTPLFCELVNNPNFPYVLQNKVFGYQGMRLQFKKLINHGTSFMTTDLRAKRDVRFSMEIACDRCGSPKNCPLGFQPHVDQGGRCVE